MDAIQFQEVYVFALKAGVFTLAFIVSLVVPVLIIKKYNPQKQGKKKLKIEDLQKKYQKNISFFKSKTLNKKDLKNYLKSLKSKGKQNEKKSSRFVLSFTGDKMASQVESLREEITLILSVAKPKDEVIVLLDSPGGSVAHYGLAADQLQRLRNKKIPLTICVDKMAGSGGYLMACVANQILASPFAFIGSIGVIFGLPNIHDYLKKHDIRYEEITAGKFKRTLTPFGEVTEEKKERLKQQLSLIHEQFKNFVSKYRSQVDLEKVATGEAWLAEEALKKGLVDKIQCSDDYILEQIKNCHVYKISFSSQKSVLDKLFKKIEDQQSLLKENPYPFA